MRNATQELLGEIYIGARSGCEAIRAILPRVSDAALLQSTTAQMEMYCVLSQKAEQMLQGKQFPCPSFPLASRLAVRSGVILETMDTSSQPEVAQVLRRAASDGAERMRAAVYALQGEADPDALALAQRMVGFEENLGGTFG